MNNSKEKALHSGMWAEFLTAVYISLLIKIVKLWN